MTWVAVGVAGASLISGKGAEKKADRANRAAESREAARQDQIGRTTQLIDYAYDNPARKKQYDDFATALRGFYGEDLGRQKADADRNLKFSLARSGLTGGSAAVDTGKRLGDEYVRGTLESERRTQGSLADLMSADQSSRLNLINMAQSGMDATTGATRAAEAMRSNIGSATSQSRAQGLGDIFAGTTGLYNRQREEAGRRRALGYDATRQDLYGRP
jgi:hypothetical protein